MRNLISWRKLKPWLIILSAIPAFVILAIVLQYGLGGGLSLILGFGFSIEEANEAYPILFRYYDLIGTILLGILFIWIYWVKIQKNSFVSIGFQNKKRLLKESLGGIITGTILISVTFFSLLIFSQIEIVKINFQLELILFPLLSFIVTGFFEETIFRGYLVGSIMKLANKYLALILVAMPFSIAHFVNGINTFSLIPTLNIFLAGILLGVVYIHTNRLWFPIAIHFIWNFLLGPVCGSPVSGVPQEHSIIEIDMVGSSYLTGGDFGFEGSVIMTVLIIILILILEIIYRIKSTEREAM